MPPRAAILGAGECFMKMAPGIRNRFEIGAIYDPDENAVGWSTLLEPERRAVATSEQQLWEQSSNVDVVFILTPPTEHARQVVLACALGKAVFVEKPLAVDVHDLEAIERAINRNPRVYFSDFYVDVRGAILVRAFGVRPGTVAWIGGHIDRQDGNPALIGLRDALGEVHLIRGRLLEGEGGARSIEHRGWLASSRGGGVLLDLAYHYLTLYYALFKAPLIPEVARLGVHPRGAEGPNFVPWHAWDGLAETYAYVKFRSGVLTIEFEVAKNWTHDSREFLITGAHGDVLMDFGTLRGLKNRLQTRVEGHHGTAVLSQRYWDLVAEGFYHYISSSPLASHGYMEGRRALETIAAVKDVAARSA